MKVFPHYIGIYVEEHVIGVIFECAPYDQSSEEAKQAASFRDDKSHGIM